MSATNINRVKFNKTAKLGYEEAKERITKEKMNKHKRSASRFKEWEEA